MKEVTYFSTFSGIAGFELGIGDLVEISDTQRYKVLGNAVTTCVIKEIAKRLL